MATSFQVRHDSLDDAARTLPSQVGVLGDTRVLLLSRQVPAGAFANVATSSEISTVHSRAIDDNARQLADAGQRLDKIIDDLRATTATVRQFDEAQATKQHQQGLERLDAENRPRVQAALDAERANLDNLRATHADRDTIAASAAKIGSYERILAGDTRILHFDPTGNGRIVGLVGELNGNTRSVGVLVPGVGTNISNFPYYDGISRGFADPARAGGGVAMITWMGGDFPQNLYEGAWSTYEQDLAPRLRDFVNDELRPQLGPDTTVTVVGHSYGGAVVGMADAAGMRADNVVHVASAGMGHEVWNPADIHNTYPVHRYSLTAPFDPIQGAQAAGPHGADPDTFPGVVHLPAGHAADGTVLYGVPAHTRMFEPDSESWRNIYGVLTGSPPAR